MGFPKTIIPLLLLFTCLAISCKKDNNRIATPTYQLDSVVIGFLDTAENFYYSRTITTDPNFIATSIPSAFIYNGTTGITFEERNDSILCNQYLDMFFAGTPLFDYCYVVDGKFNSCYHKIMTSPYSDASTHIYSQNIDYNTSGNLSTITNIQGNHYNKDASVNTLDKQKTQQLSFLYNGNNLSNIDLNFIYNNYYNGNPTDTSAYNQGEYLISYSSHYPNQKDLIGFDINDIILSSLLDVNYFNDLGYIRTIEFTGLYEQLEFYNLKIGEPLVLTKHATFNTNCENLIEHIHFNYTLATEASLFHFPFNASSDVFISYKFDTVNNNRIKTMTIQTVPSELAAISWPYYTGNPQKLKYTFYYKD